MMGQEEGCSRTVFTPLSTCCPHRSCRGRCLIHPPGAQGATSLWDGVWAQALHCSQEGSPMCEGSWESTPAAST